MGMDRRDLRLVMLGAGIICVVLALAVVMRFFDLYSGMYPASP
jgi:hypothetical protein